MNANCSFTGWLVTVVSVVLTIVALPFDASSQDAIPFSNGLPTDVLSRVVSRIDALEQENEAMRNESARLLSLVQAGSFEPQVTGLPSTSVYQPGEGVTISMRDNATRLTIGATLSGLSTFSTTRQFSPSLPLLLYPASPTDQATNTFDLHARQSSINARFSGEEFWGLKPGGELYTLFFNDNITDDNYGLLVYFAYGELKNDQRRFAAGIQKDIFNPLGPTVLPISVLYASGNSGSYRGQIRWERYENFENGSQLTLQLGLSEPIASLVRNQLIDPLVEDNGWPNIEGRLLFGHGEERKLMGGRKQRPIELGVSGVVGQIRVTKPVPGPGTPGPDRIVNDAWAIGCDFQWACTDRFGVRSEFFVGQTLAEYNAGALQNFNSQTFEPVGTMGGFGEIYCYLHPNFHVHVGYGIDDPVNSSLAPGQISSNRTLFSTAIWDISKNFQFGMEVDCRSTDYLAPLLRADGVLIMNQFLWKF